MKFLISNRLKDKNLYFNQNQEALITELSADFSAQLTFMMSYFSKIGWTVSERLSLVMALNVGSVELTSFATFDFGTLFLSTDAYAKFEAATTSVGLMFAIEFTNMLVANTNIEMTAELFASLELFFSSKIYEATSLSFALYSNAFTSIESAISADVLIATRVEIYQSFSQLAGFDSEEFATGN